MALEVSKADVWAATIEDQPGGLAAKLTALAGSGVNIEFLISRRTLEKPGKGVVFLAPIKGAKQVKAARDAGFSKTDSLHSVRIAGPDKPGLGARMAQALADAGINLRGVSAAALGKRFVGYLALDTTHDSVSAIKVLKKLR